MHHAVPATLRFGVIFFASPIDLSGLTLANTPCVDVSLLEITLTTNRCQALLGHFGCYACKLWFGFVLVSIFSRKKNILRYRGRPEDLSCD